MHKVIILSEVVNQVKLLLFCIILITKPNIIEPKNNLNKSIAANNFTLIEKPGTKRVMTVDTIMLKIKKITNKKVAFRQRDKTFIRNY